MSLAVAQTLESMRDLVALWRRERSRVAIVPTMGALHDGHLSLVQAALARADRVVVTIFVNPRQFNNASDLAAYPQSLQQDVEKLTTAGAHLLYAPDAAQMYPEGFATTISVRGIGEEMCGAFRPGHFDGVATVVAKLFLQTGADLAFFGEKDFQQLHVVRRMACDLNIPVRVVACPTVRETDGLAMSSRNARLTPAERRVAPKLAATLFAVAERLSAGCAAPAALAEGIAVIRAAGFREVEYLELRANDDLRRLQALDRPARLLVAAWLGDTRLIDNVEVSPRARASAPSE